MEKSLKEVKFEFYSPTAVSVTRVSTHCKTERETSSYTCELAVCVCVFVL